jgi:phospholipase/carboxylesterase
MAAELEYRIAGAERARDGGPVVVLLHGRGADEGDLFGLARQLPAGWVIVTPRAPFPAAPWGYGPGWAWYRYLGGNRPEPEGFEASLRSLAALLGRLAATLGVEIGRVVLGGFSQGGTVSTAYALAAAAGELGDEAPRISRIVNLSGFLADHPLVRAMPETVPGTHFFWGHGTADANIPFSLALEGRAALRRAGASLTTHDYPIGHWIDPREIKDVAAWVEAVGASGTPPGGAGAR